MNIYSTIIKNEFPIKSTAFEYIYRIIVAFIAIRFGHHYPSHDSLRLPSGLVARSPRCNLASRRLSDGRDFSTYPRLQIAFCTGVARLCARGPTVQRRIQRPHYVPVSCIRRQQRRVVGTRTRGPVYVSHGCTHPCIQAAIRGTERVSTRSPMGFQNRPSFVRTGSLSDSILVASLLHAILSSSWLRNDRATVKLCAMFVPTSLGIGGSRRYLTQSRHLDLR